jgi:hypothetical protein
LPYLKIDPNGTITLKGTGEVLILIDGKGNRQSTKETNNQLKSMRSDNIEKIEIYTNPPAKFDAQGAAVVNIITKKDKMYSEAHSSYDSRLYPESGNNGLNYNAISSGATINYGFDKWKLSGTVDLTRFNNSFDKSVAITQFPNSVRESINKSENNTFNDINSSLSIGYDFDTKNEIVLKASYSTNLIPNEYSQNTVLRDNKNIILQKINATLISSASNEDIGLIASFTHKFDKSGNKKISFDANYGQFFSSENLGITFSNELPKPFNQTSDYFIQHSSAKGDFTTNWKEYTLETGAKFTQIQNRDDYLANIDASRFSYKETILAYYLSTKKTFNKFSIQGGLRTEWTQSTGKSSLVKDEIVREYLNIFPSLFVQYTINDNASLNFSANKRIIRPSFSSFNPASYVTNDAFATMAGNSNLLPQFIYKYEIGGTFKDFNIVISYTLNKNNRVVFGMDKGDNILRQEAINQNLGNWTMNLYYPINITAKWQSTQMATLYNYAVLSPNVPNRAWTYDFNTTQTYQINDKTSVEFTVSYAATQRMMYWKMSDVFMSGIAIKTTLKNDFDLSFRIDNLLGTGKMKWTSDYGGTINTSTPVLNSRGFNISLNYRFRTGNKFKINRRKTNDFGEIRH